MNDKLDRDVLYGVKTGALPYQTSNLYLLVVCQ